MNDCLKEICSFEEFIVENISTEVFSADDYITLGNCLSGHSLLKRLCTYWVPHSHA